jgi:hypothetical protein
MLTFWPYENIVKMLAVYVLRICIVLSLAFRALGTHEVTDPGLDQTEYGHFLADCIIQQIPFFLLYPATVCECFKTFVLFEEKFGPSLR